MSVAESVRTTFRAGRLPRPDGAVAAFAAALAALAALQPGQVVASLSFTLDAFAGVLPFLALSVAIAAGARASGADGLIARAFVGREGRMVFAGALFGALSPFCSCGVIPVIAALLSMGVPLAPVMAFWLASPVMDPTMFVLTAGTLGLEFALAKTLAAVGLGLLGGFGTWLAIRAGALGEPLRDGIGNGGCGAASVRDPRPVLWRFWREDARLAAFARAAWSNALFLGKWLALAFLLESVMLAYVPATLVERLVGDGGALTILWVTLAGIPAYLNGYAALPLAAGLVDQGMAEGAALAFLVAGGVTSIPAAIAVWALARRHVFALYIAFALAGSFAAGLAFQVALSL